MRRLIENLNNNNITTVEIIHNSFRLNTENVNLGEIQNNIRNDLQNLQSSNHLETREVLRTRIEEHFLETQQLASLNFFRDVEAIDTETIININNLTTSERAAFLNNVINDTGRVNNLTQMLSVSPNHVLTHINNLLNIDMLAGIAEIEALYPLSNFFLYLYTGMAPNDFTIYNIGNDLRQAWYEFRSFQIYNTINFENNNFTTLIHSITNNNDQQLNSLRNQFFEQIDQRNEQMSLDRTNMVRRNILIGAAGVLGINLFLRYGLNNLIFSDFLFSNNMLFTSEQLETIVSENSSRNVQIRDIYDAILKQIYKLINK